MEFQSSRVLVLLRKTVKVFIYFGNKTVYVSCNPREKKWNKVLRKAEKDKKHKTCVTKKKQNKKVTWNFKYISIHIKCKWA